MIKDEIAKNETAKPGERELALLREQFPSCFGRDGSFDAERFLGLLDGKVTVAREGYEMKFLGKNYARLLATLETTTVVVPDVEHNARPENAGSRNLYLSGDNLDALKHLLKSYAGRIKCIYIDPPYNTGSDGFVYRDKFRFTAEELSAKLSVDPEQARRILDLTKRGSASHSAWLTFMYPRLQLARDLLSSNGVIFISIDDNEQANLKLLCDEIFGEENNVANLVWRKKYTGGKGTSYFADYHEYILVYARDIEKIDKIFMKRSEEEREKFDCEDEYWEERGYYYTRPLKSNLDSRPTLVYPITLPDGSTVTTQWICAEETYRKLLAEGRIEFKDPQTSRWPVYKKFYEYDDDGTTKIPSFLEVSNNNEGKAELKKLFGIYQTRDLPFQTPKPTKLLRLFIDNFLSDGDCVLDFFSGSASTADALMQSAAERGLDLHFIVVQLDEDLDRSLGEAPPSERKKTEKTIGFLDSVSRKHTLDQIGIERILRAARRIRETHPDTAADLGFLHYTLKEPSALTLDKLERFDPDGPSPENSGLVKEFGLPTVLATWLVRDGYGLTGGCEKLDLAGYEAYWKDKHVYLIGEGITDEAIAALAARYETDGTFNPENVVLFGYSFTWTQREGLKINLMRLKDTQKNLRVNFDVRY